MVSTWRWLGRRREREVIAHCLRHLSVVEEEARHLISEVKYVIEGKENVLKSYKRVFDLERNADEVKREIIDALSAELFHPLSREELVRLTLTIDDIANLLKSAGRRLLMLVRVVESPRKEIVEKYLMMLEKILQQILLLKDAVTLLAEDTREAIKKADEVERLEEEVDEIRSEVEEHILRLCYQDLGIVECLLYSRILEIIEGASDKCEDVGDVVRSIALTG